MSVSFYLNIARCSIDGCPGVRRCKGKSRCDVRFHEGLVVVIRNDGSLADARLTVDNWLAEMKKLSVDPANGRSSKYTSIKIEVDEGFMIETVNPKDRRSKLYQPTDKILDCINHPLD